MYKRQFYWYRKYTYFLSAHQRSGSDIKFYFDGVLVPGEVKYRLANPGSQDHMARLLDARRQVLTTSEDLQNRATLLNGKRPIIIASNTKVFTTDTDFKLFLAGGGSPRHRLIYLYSEDPSEYFEASPSNFLGDPSDVIRFTPDEPKPHTLIKLLSGEM